MFPQVNAFEFSAYRLNKHKYEICFDYLIILKNNDKLTFTEKIQLPNQPNWDKIPPELLKTVLESLHLILGISYWKMFVPKNIVINNFSLSKKQANFWNTTYTKGLSEFFFRNRIKNFNCLINFPYQDRVKNKPVSFPRQNRSLVAIGGGKDSIVNIELLKKNNFPTTSFVVETGKNYPVVDTVINQSKIGSLVIKRKPDPKLYNLDDQFRPLKGHIPISAIYAFLGVFAAMIYDYRYFIVGNEKSADEENTKYNGQLINHQWSKTSEFELLFQNYVKDYLTPDINYFSLLRPLYELRIAQEFSQYPKYWPVFSSCNRNFSLTKAPPANRWCGHCPKCASVFLLLAPFIDKDHFLKIFTKNLFNDEKLFSIYKQLLGLEGVKPFDCVATIEESRLALYLVWQKKEYQGNLLIKLFEKEILPKLDIEKMRQKQFFLLSRGALPMKSGRGRLSRKKIALPNLLDNIPDLFKLVMAEKVLILGYGKEGQATEKFLKAKYPQIKIGIADKNLSPDYLEKQKDYELVIKTPGIKKELVIVPYTTATNLFFASINNLVIGVTGSKGKSTTASLIYHILKTAGKPVRLIGNIGNPVLLELLKPPDEETIYVMELSSYQLDDIHYSPQIAVITNLFPEHMTYHGDVNKYFLAKKNIFLFQKPTDYFIFNPDNETLRLWSQEATCKSKPFDPIIKIDPKDIPLLGKHNLDNLKAAITVAHLLQIEDETIIQALKTFKPLPHRLEFVGRFADIEFYDDAISTAPESTMAAIDALKNVGTIFLGGEDRGYDFSLLVKVLAQSQIPNIVLFPETGAKIHKLIIKQTNYQPKVLKTTSMDQAVKFAYQYTPKNSICLLSTASPSYSLWKNFEEKGNHFKFFIKKIGQKKFPEAKSLIG